MNGSGVVGACDVGDDPAFDGTGFEVEARCTTLKNPESLLLFLLGSWFLPLIFSMPCDYIIALKKLN
jgi:hypothetical protein